MDDKNKKNVPDWKLEQYLFGELPPEDLEAIAALEATDETMRNRLNDLRKDDAEFSAKFPPEWEIRKLRSIQAARLKSNGDDGDGRRHGLKNVSRWAIPAAACAAVVLIIVVIQIVTQTSLPLPSSTPPVPEAHHYIKERDSMETMIADDVNFTRDTILLEQGW